MRWISCIFFSLVVWATMAEARDPTQPPGGSAPQKIKTKSLKLTGIFQGRQARAVINGEIFTVGERRHGIELLKVESGRVLVKWHGTKQWLTLVPTKVKRRERK
ncbi:MAG: hypothetical protein D6694_12010 [Gammaproteobacteria bacterium]|nr:MAG: hypothetical protein D6694_12010 [Gammaproteobacteria bacterium]